MGHFPYIFTQLTWTNTGRIVGRIWHSSVLTGIGRVLRSEGSRAIADSRSHDGESLPIVSEDRRVEGLVDEFAEVRNTEVQVIATTGSVDSVRVEHWLLKMKHYKIVSSVVPLNYDYFLTLNKALSS